MLPDGFLPWMLVVAFVVHDGEEVATTRWLREHRDELADLVERSAAAYWLHGATATTRIGVAARVSFEGLLVVGVTAWATGAGSSLPEFLYVSVLAAFVAHVLFHLVQAAYVRGYVPGVATGVLVVWPIGGYVYWRLFAAGVLTVELAGWTALVGLVGFLPVVLFAGRVGRAVERRF